ncbi:hypothetical protein HNR62_001246 [Oceanisphaera litoralis]|nr:hypothetical protein [Oceanisphaera litoralis]
MPNISTLAGLIWSVADLLSKDQEISNFMTVW